VAGVLRSRSMPVRRAVATHPPGAAILPKAAAIRPKAAVTLPRVAAILPPAAAMAVGAAMAAAVAGTAPLLCRASRCMLHPSCPDRPQGSEGRSWRLPFPLTGAMDLPDPTPPPNPYGVKRANVECTGQTIGLPVGVEVRVGRDPSRAGLLVEDPRVSGLHASLRFDGASAFVRDEHSSLGTEIDGVRLAPGAWHAVPPHGLVHLGPVPLHVRVE